MAEAEQKLANGTARIDFAADPSRYRHWKLIVDGTVATLVLDGEEKGSLFAGYDLKLNSYDLGVDIELADAFERIRFEHPQVRVVLLRSGKPRVFCAGANIRMLAGSSHAHKVNFCKFTNETRNSMEDASRASGQKYICAVRGTAAGRRYELALATDHILLADDGSPTLALPALPLPARLPALLNDACRHWRCNDPAIAVLIFKSQGEPAQVAAYDAFLDANKSNWLAREVLHYWKRVLKRVDLTSRSLVALIEPGSCFAGTFAEIVFAADRSYMLIGSRDGDNRPPARIILGGVNLSGMLEPGSMSATSEQIGRAH